MTALCVLRGMYVAVGEPSGGSFLLPRWEIWEDWARDAISLNRIDRRLPAAVDVWIDGTGTLRQTPYHHILAQPLKPPRDRGHREQRRSASRSFEHDAIRKYFGQRS